MLTRRLTQLAAALLVFSIFQAPPGYAAPQQDAANAPAKQATPAINFRERPRYPSDPQRMKRRPVLDGVLADNEWDPLYTISDKAVNGTVYANWDDEYLYFAAKTDQPAWIVFDVDANGDGWLRGADNLELTLSPQSETSPPALTARVLDSASGKDAPVWNEKVVDPKAIKMAAKVSGTSHIVEIAIPRGTAGLVLRAGGSLGVRADFLPAAATPIPTQPYEPHLLLDIKLVETVVVSAPGIAPILKLDDDKLIPGEPLKATMELLGQTEEVIQVKSITWKGEGAAGDLLRQVRDPSVGAITLKKPLKLHYSSPLPENATPGFYQITCSADLEGGRTVVSTKGFSIVEPIKQQVLVQPDVISVGAQQVKLKVLVEITGAAPGYTRGDVQIEVPGGWVVEGRVKKGFEVPREDGTIRAGFIALIPPATQAGDYIVHATVTWHGKTWKSHTTVKVNKTGEAEPAKPADTKKP